MCACFFFFLLTGFLNVGTEIRLLGLTYNWTNFAIMPAKYKSCNMDLIANVHNNSNYNILQKRKKVIIMNILVTDSPKY